VIISSRIFSKKEKLMLVGHNINNAFVEPKNMVKKPTKPGFFYEADDELLVAGIKTSPYPLLD
jgi:hypothetical protein